MNPTTEQIIAAATDQGQRIESIGDAVRQEHEAIWSALEKRYRDCSSQD